MTVQKTKHKLDIFQLLKHINNKDINFYDDLKEEEQKGFFPLVVMRWLSGTRSEDQINRINLLVNPMVFSIHKHPKLLYYLMTICSSGSQQRYVWNKKESKKSSSTPITISIISQYFEYSYADAKEILDLLSKENIISYAEELGTQPDIMKKLKIELRNR